MPVSRPTTTLPAKFSTENFNVHYQLNKKISPTLYYPFYNPLSKLYVSIGRCPAFNYFISTTDWNGDSESTQALQLYWLGTFSSKSVSYVSGRRWCNPNLHSENIVLRLQTRKKFNTLKIFQELQFCRSPTFCSNKGISTCTSTYLHLHSSSSQLFLTFISCWINLQGNPSFNWLCLKRHKWSQLRTS